MTIDSRRLFADVVRSPEVDLGLACLLIGKEASPDLDVEAGRASLDGLAEAAAPFVESATSPADVAAGLGTALGARAGLHGTEADYGDLRSSLLHEVLRRRHGLPILLSVVYLEVARRLGRPAAGIGLPGHFVIGVFGAAEPVLVDPFAGGRLTTAAELVDRVRAVTGTTLVVTGDLLAPWTPVDILGRVLANIRAHSTTGDALRTRLWAVELGLLLPHHSAALRRERGELLARLGDFVASAEELERYAAAVADADSDAAALAVRHARLVRSRLS